MGSNPRAIIFFLLDTPQEKSPRIRRPNRRIRSAGNVLDLRFLDRTAQNVCPKASFAFFFIARIMRE